MARRYAAEFLGTFAIVFFGCGAIATSSDPLAINVVFGLIVAAMIYALGHISAAHFNPAVTLGFAVAKRFPWRFAPGYMASQFAGAVAASGLHVLLIPDLAAHRQFGMTASTIDPGCALGVEGLITFFLMLVIISVATDRRVNGAVAGLSIGATVTLCGLFAGPLTGSSMNPARSVGPALFSGHFGQIGIYIAGPLLGASSAAILYEWLRGGSEHGNMAPNDLFAALEQAKLDAAS